jgi:hypothetical protein
MKKLKMGTNEAYAFVKERSPWIGPNMSLIYQLTDYGRLCGYEKKHILPPSTETNSAPGSAPLENLESQRYVGSPKTILPSHVFRPSIGRTQSQDRRHFVNHDETLE